MLTIFHAQPNRPVVIPGYTGPRNGMFRALSPRNFRSLRDRCVPFECRHVDAGSRAGMLVLQLTNSAFWLGLERLWPQRPPLFLHFSEVFLLI